MADIVIDRTDAQIKAGIEKASDLQSSASEIDGAVDNHITQAELDAVVLGSGNVTPEQAYIIENSNNGYKITNPSYFNPLDGQSFEDGVSDNNFITTDVEGGRWYKIVNTTHASQFKTLISFLNENNEDIEWNDGNRFTKLDGNEINIYVPENAVKIKHDEVYGGVTHKFEYTRDVVHNDSNRYYFNAENETEVSFNKISLSINVTDITKTIEISKRDNTWYAVEIENPDVIKNSVVNSISIDYKTSSLGYIINNAGDIVLQTAASRISGFVPVVSNAIYKLNSTNDVSKYLYYIVYDKDFNPIDNHSQTAMSKTCFVTIPNDGVYIRYNLSWAALDYRDSLELVLYKDYGAGIDSSSTQGYILSIDKSLRSNEQVSPLYYSPPVQKSGKSQYNSDNRVDFTLSELYAKWDELMTNNEGYITRDIASYTSEVGDYELRRYTFSPRYPKKTIVIGSGVHGSEVMNKATMLKIAQILCDNQYAHPSLSYIRNNVRLVVIPVVNPWGHENNSLSNGNKIHNASTIGVNVNRNFDFNWVDTVTSGNMNCGSEPFSENEAKWYKETLDLYEDITFAMDMHDAPAIPYLSSQGHIWLNYIATHPNANDTFNLADYLAEKYLSWIDRSEWDLSLVSETETGGVCSAYMGKTLGLPSSTTEVVYSAYEDQVAYSGLATTGALEHNINIIIINAMRDAFDNTEKFDSIKYWFKYLKGLNEIGVKTNSSIEQKELKIDKLVNNGFFSKTFIGRGQGDEHDVNAYIYEPLKYDNTVLIIGGQIMQNTDYRLFQATTYRMFEMMSEYKGKDKEILDILKSTRFVYVPFLTSDSISVFGLEAEGFNIDGTLDLTNDTANLFSTIVTNYSPDSLIFCKSDSDLATYTRENEFILGFQNTNDSKNISHYVEELKAIGETNTLLAVEDVADDKKLLWWADTNNISCVCVKGGFDNKTYLRLTSENQITMNTTSWRSHGWETSRMIRDYLNLISLLKN